LDGFPFLERSLDCNKIFVLGIFGMLFDGSASASKPSSPSKANRGQCRQRVRVMLQSVAVYSLAQPASSFGL
jgi:hypothetical protein